MFHSNPAKKDASSRVSTAEQHLAATMGAGNYHSSRYKELNLLFEFKKLQSCIPGGIYVMPMFDNLFVWHGVIFIRSGLFKDGVFKFIIVIPEGYPEARPQIRFTTRLYHPQISHDGSVDLSVPFPTWEPGKSTISGALAYVKRLFYYVSADKAVNRDAAETFEKNKGLFQEKISECVKLSQSNKLQNNEKSSIKFDTYQNKHNEIRNIILSGEAKRSAEDGGENCYSKIFDRILGSSNQVVPQTPPQQQYHTQRRFFG